MFLKKDVIKKLSKELSLPFTGIEQDWDLEMANPKMINKILKFYKEKYLSIDEKYALMSLLLSSYEDFLNERNICIDDQWNEIKEIIILDKNIYTSLLDYWLPSNREKHDDIFKITPLIKILKEIL